MTKSIAALSMRGLVLRFTPTPTVEPMTTGTQPMPPQAGFDRELFGTVSRPDSSFIEIESHIGRALLLALKSLTMHRRTEAQVRMLCQRRSASGGHETYRKKPTKILVMAPAIDSWVAPRRFHAVPTLHIAVNTHNFSHFVGRCFPCVDSSCIHL